MSGRTLRRLFLLLAAASPSLADAVFLETLAHFNAGNGKEPVAALIQASDGNFYGTTLEGGSGGRGTVFRVTPSGTLTSLVHFNRANGDLPRAPLVEVSDGIFYGTTSGGPGDQTGLVFRLTSSGQLSAFRSFESWGAGATVGAILMGSDGSFFGTTKGGGSGAGTVFKISPEGVLTTLVKFSGMSDPIDDTVPPGVPEPPNPQFQRGANPGDLFLGSDGNFYGITQSWPVIVFRVTPGGAFTKLFDFGYDYMPRGSLIEGKDGFLYGLAWTGSVGGSDIVYRISREGSMTILATMKGANGKTPVGNLIQGRDGNFYGVTAGGGLYDKGTVFRMTPAGALTTLIHFQGPNGAQPGAGLVQALDGMLYGTTTSGGLNDFGTVFRVGDLSSGPGDDLEPVITSTLNASAAVGRPFSYRIVADNAPTSFGAASLPPGLTLDSATGLITGTPATKGSFDVDISASNSYGTATARLKLAVSADAPASAPPGTVSFKERSADKVVTTREEGETYYDVMTQGSFSCRGKLPIVPAIASHNLDPETPLTVSIGQWSFETVLGSGGNFQRSGKAARFKLPTGAAVSLVFGKTTLTWSVSAKTGAAFKNGEFEELEFSPVAEDLFQDETYNITAAQGETVEVSITLGDSSTGAQIPITGSAKYSERKVGAGDEADEFGLNSVSIGGKADATVWE